MKTSCSLSRRIGFTLSFILGAWAIGLHAQPGSQDFSFNAATIKGEIGFSVAVQPDGRVIAAGTFGVMRFLTNGSVDPSFQSIPPGPAPYVGPGSGIGEVVLQPDGRILVTGTFTNAAGTPLPGIFRLNSDGSIDPSFNAPTTYPGGRVLALQPDGKVVGGLGGLFRLLPDGSADPNFDASWYNSSADFYSLALAPDGKIYFGTFETFARVNPDGSRDESFNPELGIGPWGAIAVQRDGKVLVGSYTDGAGPSFRPVRRLLPDGTDDPAWTVTGVSGGDGVVFSLLVQPDGKVLVGGNGIVLMGSNDLYNDNLGRLNPDGSVDLSFDSRVDLHYYSVEAMALAPDGKVVVAGMQLSPPRYTPAPAIWRLSNDTGLQPQLDIRFSVNEGITVRLTGQSGATYRLEFREQLPGAGAWTPLTNLTLSGSSATWQDTEWTNSRSRFYRAVSVQ